MGIKILVADDHQVVRAGLRFLFEKQQDMEVVGEAENGRATVRLAENLAPDVIIMDISMPDLNGIDATRQILAQNAGIRVIALSMHSDRRFVERMLGAGAAGYTLKNRPFEELVNAVRTVAAGQTYLCPEVASIVVKEYVSNTAADDASVLSAREREVLQLVAEGRSTKDIASRLNVSGKTIETHRQNIMKKLEIKNMADLVKYAIREGLTSLEG